PIKWLPAKPKANNQFTMGAFHFKKVSLWKVKVKPPKNKQPTKVNHWPFSKRRCIANKVPYTTSELMIKTAVALKIPPRENTCPANSISRGSSLKTIKNKIRGIKSMNCFTVRAITERKRHNSKHSRK